MSDGQFELTRRRSAVTRSATGLILDDARLERDRRDEEDAERVRRATIYEAWVHKWGRIGDDFAGVLAGTAAPPEAPAGIRLPGERDCLCPRCSRRAAQDGALCASCRHEHHALHGSDAVTARDCSPPTVGDQDAEVSAIPDHLGDELD